MAAHYTVKPGDTLAAIARRRGLTWQDLYNHPDNAALRRTRPNPNLIYPGDLVLIPESAMHYYEVPGMTLIPQQDETSCWYASTQMLIHWKMKKFGMSLTALVPPEIDAECLKIRDAGGGIINPQIMAMANRLGLRAVPPISPTAQHIELLLSQHGPLWVNGNSHIVVIAGVKGLSVKVYDPWPPKLGKVDWRSLMDWYVGGVNPPNQPDSTRDTRIDVDAVFLYCP